MSNYEEVPHNCVPNLIRIYFIVGNQNNSDYFGFSLHHLNTGLGKMYGGFCTFWCPAELLLMLQVSLLRGYLCRAVPTFPFRLILCGA